MFVHNKNIILSGILPISYLKNKHNLIFYHRSREEIFAVINKLSKIPGKSTLVKYSLML